MNRLNKFGPVILRVALCLVFLWFGTNQLMHPEAWVKLIPAWASSLVGGNPVTFVHLNGWFEVVAALTLLAGFQVRAISLILSIHLFSIATMFGLVATGVRDFGLSLAMLSIFFSGPDIWSVDRRLIKPKEPSQSAL